MKEEKPVGIVFSLDREKPGVVFAPERVLPMRLEVICLPHIGAATRGRSLRISFIAAVTASASLRAAAASGSWPGTSG